MPSPSSSSSSSLLTSSSSSMSVKPSPSESIEAVTKGMVTTNIPSNMMNKVFILDLVQISANSVQLL